MTALAAPAARKPAVAVDPRVAAFCQPSRPETFNAIVYGNQIWTSDPFDVPSIHAEARAAFDCLLDRASSSELPKHGSSLLLLGEAGSGKTHLLRAFRAEAHQAGSGYCGYLQMTTRCDNYARYLLGNLVDSLEQPYKQGHNETGLSRLARGIVDRIEIPEEDRSRLADDPTLSAEETAALVHRLAYAAVQDSQFRSIDIDVIRGVLFTLSNDVRLHALALKWLRCEDLNRHDRDLLGDLVPRPQPEMPLKTVIDLGRLVHAVHTAALVLLVDQIEQIIECHPADSERGQQFRLAIDTLVDVTEQVPNAVVVVGCLEDLYTLGQKHLSGAKRDRLEKDPDTMRLTSARSEADIEAMIVPRLAAIFEEHELAVDSVNPIAPYQPLDLKKLLNLRPRDILESFRRHREKCIDAGRWLVPDWSEPSPTAAPAADWEQSWNDFRSLWNGSVPGTEPELAELLAWSIRAVSDETPNGLHFGAEPEGRFIPVEIESGVNRIEKLFVAVCDKNARGGGLGKQVSEVAYLAGEIPVVLVRSTDFPKTASSDASKEIAKLTAPRGPGRKLVVADSDWRAMAAFRQFYADHRRSDGFSPWQRTERPLAELRSLQTILNLSKLLAAPPAATVPPEPPRPTGLPKPELPYKPVALPVPMTDAAIRLGETRSANPNVIDLVPKNLCRHAAFLGGAGSGKTTAALTVIEQLLLAGVPVVLIDRKGDLAQYADSTAWERPESDPARAGRRNQLRAAIDVRLYTPGEASGRPLAISIVPADLGQITHSEREQMAQYSAASLGMMLGYKGRSPDPKIVILQKAIEILSRGPALVTVKAVQQLVADRDDDLTVAAGFDDKHYKKLSEDLLTLAHQHRRLLEAGERLDIDHLLGRGPHATGKTALSIVSTQFLGDPATTDFWVSQFLIALDRWRSKNPAPEGRLQAVFFFDEADQYLPATKTPATKGPMEGLLKRARSAGLGIFLATQSPGDLDYKCRDNVLTWLIGKVKETRAVEKLKPMLSAARVDVTAKLAGQEAGQFYLVRESDVTPIRVDQNLIPTSQLPEERILAIARPET